jgi:hypothetical protein
MQKWEYLFLVTNDSGTQVRILNDRELRDWKKGPITSEFVNSLGEQGWEMVGYQCHFYGSSTQETRMTFKRPKP